MVVLKAAAEVLALDTALRYLGTKSVVRGQRDFFPHVLMPEYRSPQFDEAVRRLVLPARGPNILFFSLTDACPSKCEYCFAGSGGRAPDDIGDDAAFAVAEAVAESGIPLVNISGGEPLSRYRRVVKTVEILSPCCEVRLFTSGIGLTGARLAQLSQAGLRGVFVSLDTDDAERFDRARGIPGAFTAAVDALKMCARAKMPTFVNCVVDRERFAHRDDVERFLRFVEGIDPSIVIRFLPLLATGRGKHADSFRDPAECEAVADRITATAEELGRPIAMLFGRVDAFIGCPGAGGKLMNIDGAGNVTVCISRAALGNVLEEPFANIYERFVTRCRRLQVGFFCCDVGERADAPDLLDPAASQRALERFYAKSQDADWQRALDRYGWLLRRLVAP